MKKIKMNAGKLQLNKSNIASLNGAALQLVNGGLNVGGTGGDTGAAPVRPIPASVPYYVTCLNCNPHTNSVSCCDGV